MRKSTKTTSANVVRFPSKKRKVYLFGTENPDDVFVTQMSDNSLIGSGIYDNDTLVCHKVSDFRQIENGTLVIVNDQNSKYVARHFYFIKGQIILRSSNSDYGELRFAPKDVEIIAVVIQVVKNLRLVGGR